MIVKFYNAYTRARHEPYLLFGHYHSYILAQLMVSEYRSNNSSKRGVHRYISPVDVPSLCFPAVEHESAVRVELIEPVGPSHFWHSDTPDGDSIYTECLGCIIDYASPFDRFG
jgi:hypothetical protein